MVKVSIIMPVYNGQRFLKPAIDSALAQTYADWELIIIDDGSTDQTPDILAGYTDPRIIKIRQANGGEASARNTGLARAQGEYISFLDADDLYLPNALADFTGFLDSHPEFDVVFADGHLCDENDRRLTRLSDHRPGIFTGNILEPLVLTASVLTVPVCTMTRRAVVEQHQIRFDRAFVIGPDWDFWIQLARYARFGNLDKIVCMYRVHLTNITRTSGVKRRIDDLIRGREKVMNSDWFAGLSEATRERFFYNLLVELATGDPQKQRALLEHPSFTGLPAPLQARLLRQTGIDIYQHTAERDLALSCVEKAAALVPGDRKTSLILQLMRSGGRTPTMLFINGWQWLHQASVRIRTIGQRKPKPVPSSLGPVKS